MRTFLDRILLQFSCLYARRKQWSPIGAVVSLSVSASRDTALCGQTLRGVIAATSPDNRGMTAKAIIMLDAELSYFGHYRRNGITAVRTSPERLWHGVYRLLIFPAIVRVIDCDVPDESQDRVIAVAEMRLEPGVRRW
jgi:hypothetical protein